MKTLRKLLVVALLLAIAAGGTYLWMRANVAPGQPGEPFLVRYDRARGLQTVLEDLKARGVVKNPAALRLYVWLYRKPAWIGAGTYSLRPRMSADDLLSALQSPIRQMVRIPETNFSNRTAKLLALPEYRVADAAEYLRLVKTPSEFAGTVNFPLPKTSLEGYLYPDTYDLPPLLGARGVIERQLQAFEREAWPLLRKAKDPYRVLIIASLIELEVAKDRERPIVAGVIENRLARGEALGIDAALNYGLGEWRPLTKADLQLNSPYNLRKVKGLPPTPICSPSVKSIKAALRPAKHGFYYYVAVGPGQKGHRFASTYGEHLKNKRLYEKAVAKG